MWLASININSQPTPFLWSGDLVPIVITPPEGANITDDLGTGFADDEGTTPIADR
jgi:hypothetical protein